MLGGKKLFSNFHNFIRDKLGSPFNVANVRIANIPGVYVIKTSNVPVTLCLESSEVENETFGTSNSVAFHGLGLLKEVCKIEHDFLGDAANVYTSATDDTVFDHAYSFTKCCSSAT